MERAAPAEAIRIGPALFEAASVALRHWPVALLSLVALCVWNGLVLVAITGCTSPAACLGPQPPGEANDWMRLGVWLGTRFIGWLVLGGTVYCILSREAGLQPTQPGERDPRLRVLLACVLCFAVSSLAVFAARVAVTIGSPALGDPAGDLSDQSRPATVIVECAIVVVVWSVLSARYAAFTASIVRRGEGAGFGRSWAEAPGARLPLLLMFLAIHVPLIATQALVFLAVPPIFDRNRFVGLVINPPYAAVAAALTAGVFVVVSRRLVGSDVRVFD